MIHQRRMTSLHIDSGEGLYIRNVGYCQFPILGRPFMAKAVLV